MRNLRANAIRVYALHPPAFYEALEEENTSHPGKPIWLFQEVWTELPAGNDFWDPSFTRGFEEEIRLTIDAIHGNAVVAPRPGHASGRYALDASRWLAGWLLGREWEPYAVRETERRHPEITSHRGRHLAVDRGTAMEAWLARICDHAATYEASGYGRAHALSFVTWPTLDPMRHPTEFERGGVEAEHDEDAYSVDPTRIRTLREPGIESGFLGYFANYHVYPYYPDFMNLDPGYGAYRDHHGACRYAGYLADLKAHTRGIPLLIGEYGVPTSRGIAHQHPEGIHHGGASEEEQGARDVRLLEDIAESGAAGSLLFSLFDEWFKVNWLVERVERPRDRDPLWLNRLDPEENYGLIGFDPPPPVRIDGAFDDWREVEPHARRDEAGGGAPGSAATGATTAGDRDAASPLRALHVTSDQTSLYLRIDLDSSAVAAPASPRKPPRRGPSPFRAPPPARVERIRTVGVSFDVLDSARGDRRLPRPLDVLWSRGAELVLLIDVPGSDRPGPPRARLLVDDAMGYSAHARARGEDGTYRAVRAPLGPIRNDNGLYRPLLIETNRERVARNGALFPALYLDTGELSPGGGRAWPADTSAIGTYDPHAEWRWSEDGTRVEVALPWGLLLVGDPSSRAVLDDRPDTPAVETSVTEGIGLLTWATTWDAAALAGKPHARAARDAGPLPVFALTPDGSSQFYMNKELRITTSRRASYVWNGWDRPITRERIKRSAAYVRRAFEGMEAREDSQNRKADARKP